MKTRFSAIVLAAAVSLSLIACSDSGDDDSSSDVAGEGIGSGGDGNGDGSAGGGTGDDGSQQGGEPLLDGSYAGVYTVGAGNELSGLALADDGSAVSVFGTLGGTLRRYDHVASRPATGGVFGPGEFAGTSTDFSATESGQSIVNADGTITYRDAASGGLLTATVESVAGNWSGRHRFLIGENEGRFLVTEVTFAGDTFSGRTRVVDDNDEGTRVDPITSGRLTPSDDALIASFEWSGNQYEGVVFFRPDNSGQLVFVGETDAEDAGNPTIGSLLMLDSN